MDDITDWKEWFPCRLCSTEKSDFKIAIMVLNRPVDMLFQEIVLQLIQKATLFTAVDGGATHAFTLFEETGKDFVPDLISGDFDSANRDVLDYFKQKGSEVVETPDVDETDFTKALRLTVQKLQQKNEMVDAVVAVCQNGGRMDHLMGNLNTLYISDSISPFPLYLVSDESVSWVLGKGKHKIYISDELQGSCCGIIPIGEPCECITTTGLKWNLSGNQIRFGELISTSNTYSEGNEVTIDTSSKVLWTMETKCIFQECPVS